MLAPSQLTRESFSTYPPEARELAAGQLPLLRRLPLSFLPLLLRELIVFDYKFPAERRDLDRQFEYLGALSDRDFTRAMANFTALRLSPELEGTDWVASPSTFSEKLTAHLWATHQIEKFRAAAVAYVRESGAGRPDPPLPTHRLGIVVLAREDAGGEYPLFRKLSPHGVRFTNVKGSNSMESLVQALAERAAAHPEPYAHWYIDGGRDVPMPGEKIARVSWGALSPVRAALQIRMQKSYENGAFDAEAFRSMLARTRPEDLGIESSPDPVLGHFQLSVLTEGSGTQVFSTTFVQWTAREAMRRAQPLTLLAQFAPRQKEKPMNELLAESQRPPELDPRGSLIDADQGAYYTWMNQQRLAGAEQAAFLALYGNQAMVIAPSFEPGKSETNPIHVSELLARIT